MTQEGVSLAATGGASRPMFWESCAIETTVVSGKHVCFAVAGLSFTLSKIREFFGILHEPIADLTLL